MSLYGITLDRSVIHEDILNSKSSVFGLSDVVSFASISKDHGTYQSGIDTFALTPNTRISGTAFVGTSKAIKLTNGNLIFDTSTYGADIYDGSGVKILSADYASLVALDNMVSIKPWGTHSVIRRDGSDVILWSKAYPAGLSILFMGSKYSYIHKNGQKETIDTIIDSPKFVTSVRRRTTTTGAGYEEGTSFIQYKNGNLEFGFTASSTGTMTQPISTASIADRRFYTKMSTLEIRFCVVNTKLLVV